MYEQGSKSQVLVFDWNNIALVCVGVLMYGVNGELEMKIRDERKKERERDKQLYIDIILYGCKLKKIKKLS